jgi:hypothetical protein
MPRLYEVYSGICLTTEEKARIILSQGSRRNYKPIENLFERNNAENNLTIYYLALLIYRKS